MHRRRRSRPPVRPTLALLLGALLVAAACDAGPSGILRDGAPADGSADAAGGGADSGGGSADSGGGSADAGIPSDDAGAGGAGLQCEACEVTEDCASGSYCVQLPSGGSVCLASCVRDLPECPARFDCVDSLITPLPDPVCTPVGERCCVDADADDRGLGVGCRGLDCNDGDPDVYEGAPELCNGIDDDCDGTVDEGDPGAGMVCSTGMSGACSAGATACEDGRVVCVPNAATTAETCNGIDEDCDGNVDEDDAGRALTRPCYDGPAGTEGVGDCAAGVQTCAGGEYRACVGQVLPGTELCNGMDENCDGVPDDGNPGGGIACSASASGICAAGTTQCVSGGLACVSTISPGTESETCDGVDNDCDASTDEGFGVGTVCTAGVGACIRAGTLQCDGAGTGTECNAVPGTPSAEICDYVDNNCDGTADEGFLYAGDPENPGVTYPIGAACAVGRGACRRGGVVECVSGAADCNAPVVSGTPETCNYADDDCDGVVDNGFVDGSGRYTGNENCGACGFSCTSIYSFPNSFGTCELVAGSPQCVQNCNAGTFNLNGVPDDGCEFSLDSGGIYVSAEDAAARDDAGCGLGPVGTGAGNYPCRTIGYGIGRAVSLGRARVRVADALYTETVSLVNGVSLLGAHRADTWERHVSTTLTTVRGPSGAGHRRTVVANGITASTLVEGFVIEGASASTAGANSYAVYVTGGTSALSFRDNVIYAGNGAPGAPGSPGSNGAPGVTGSPGLVATETNQVFCSITRLGGAGGARSCGGTSVNGGNGGNAVCAPDRDTTSPYTAVSGRNGATGANGGGGGGAAGLDGETSPVDSCLLCYLPLGGNTMTGGGGLPGPDGSNGGAGPGGSSAVGGVSGGEWTGVGGGPGGAATHGGGGGGGASGGGGDGLGSGCNDDLGATGGGGGSGACGGTQGGGGTAGGGSFGIFIVNTGSRPTLANNTIFRGFGGNGGNGGRGGTGGIGGDGGPGGLKTNANNNFCTGDGGSGGPGGDGGHGGGGGGGAGGVSYGVYAEGTSGYGAGTNTFPSSGGGGSGGSGGSSIGNDGAPGVGGASAPTN